MILSSGKFLVVGDGKSEQCMLIGDNINCLEQNPDIASNFPQLFNVPNGYCQMRGTSYFQSILTTLFDNFGLL